MDAHSRRKAALDAIAAVAGGARAADVESEIVDFKEEAGTVLAGGQRVAIAAQHEPAAQALAVEVACMAMSDRGGAIVVGVTDKAAGTAAFVGSFLDLDWLRHRIYVLTQPHFSIDVIEELFEDGKRLYLINVAPALSETRSGGKLRARFGTDCLELDGDRAREFLERWRSYDWSAEGSSERLSTCDRAALESAHGHYLAAQGRPAGSDVELLRRLGVAMEDQDDPQLNRAGAVLLCRYETDVERLDVRALDVEGAASAKREILKAPVITAFDTAWEMIDQAFPARPVIIGAQRRPERSIPERALREALGNAVMHRDYRMPRASIIAMALGRPPDTFKVVSPGDFPEGVDKDRLLATRSQPRNRALAEAMRVLGLAEREGVGIGAMYRTMLRDGHAAPDIFPEGGDVVCRLPGGRVDPNVRGFFDNLVATDDRFAEDVRSHIAITELLGRTPLRAEGLARTAQCSEDEAFEVLGRLADAGAVERLLDGSRSFRLTQRSRTALHARITYRQRTTADQQWELVRAFLDVNEEIGRADAAALLGVGEGRASNILSDLYNDRGVLEPVGAPRGRGVRYRLAS
ncbi:MAG TPA: ATP-binding protein [Solirubrobacteraceae bacterium]|nr:ATP-binding protein [Solirubrobacteraceae bacterium]